MQRMPILEQIYHQITGPESAPKLVFLHGVMGFAANWRRIAKAFEGEYQVLCYDQRGHGRSFQPASGYAPEDYAGDLKAILGELGWKSIYLVGHSMGGRVAYHFAARNPERVQRLVIEDIGPSMHPTGASLILSMLDAVPVPFASKREARQWFDADFQRLFASESKVKALAEYLYANLTENAEKQAVWRFSESGIRESVAQGRRLERWDDIHSLKMPTLLVRGERSRDLPRDLFERMLIENSIIEGVEIKDSGHWVHSDQPERFIAVLTKFLRGEHQVLEEGIEPVSRRA